MESRAPVLLIDGVEITFIDQHERADGSRDIADLAQNRFRRKRGRRVVKIRDHDEARLRRDAATNLARFNRQAVFFGAMKSLHVCFQIMSNVEDWAVSGVLD